MSLIWQMLLGFWVLALSVLMLIVVVRMVNEEADAWCERRRQTREEREW